MSNSNPHAETHRKNALLSAVSDVIMASRNRMSPQLRPFVKESASAKKRREDFWLDDISAS